MNLHSSFLFIRITLRFIVTELNTIWLIKGLCQLAKDNINRTKRTFLDKQPKYPQLWFAAVPDPGIGKKKKKKKKKGKKKK